MYVLKPCSHPCTAQQLSMRDIIFVSRGVPKTTAKTALTVLCPRMPLYDPGDTPTSENQRGWCACRSPARAIGVNPALDPRFSPCPRQTTVASCPRDLWRVRRSGVCVSSVVGTFAHFMAPCLVCSMRFCTLLSLVCALFQLFIACPSPEDDTRYVGVYREHTE